MMPERANRTFICSVLFLDIAEYSKKPVSEQIQLKDRFNRLIAESIRDIAPNDRIILDTGDGVVINFLGDPEDALFVAMSLRESFAPQAGDAPGLPARIGINLGPVRLVRDINSQPNIIGDGINVAQRVMGFAQPGQILVSRSYYEVVLHISEGYSKLFSHEGSRTDKHVREHEVYSVDYTGSRPNGIRSPAERAKVSTHESWRQASTATIATGAGLPALLTRLKPLLARIEPWLSNRAVVFGTATLSVAAFALAVLVNLPGHRDVAPRQPQLVERDIQNKAQDVTRIEESVTSAPLKPADDKTVGPAVAQAGAAPPQSRPPAPKSAAVKKKHTKLSLLAIPSRDKPAAVPGAPRMSAGSARIMLAIAPWGEVYVDGERKGISPPVRELEVPPGKRRIEIKNGRFPVYTQIVYVKADQKVRIKHKFD